MKPKKLQYRLISLGLILAILPSMLGVHVFKHLCAECHESSVVTTFVTTNHSHSHDCASCACSGACNDCHDEAGIHLHHGENACEHQFAKINLEGNITAVSINFQAVHLELLFSSDLISDLQTDFSNSKYRFHNVIQQIPDEPSPEKNCVFLL